MVGVGHRTEQMELSAGNLLPEPGADSQPPGFIRRLACFAYEGVLLFGVLMAAGLVYAIATQQRNALVGKTGLQLFLFIVLGAYFVGFWTRTGQTLAMQTWHIRLVTRTGQRVTLLRATCRYLLSWLWFLPALAGVYFAGLTAPLPIYTAMGVGVLAYAGLARLHPEREYLHDLVCGTRLITWRPAPRP
jgi:uncharacterized RDD family membrane protein YckC